MTKNPISSASGRHDRHVSGLAGDGAHASRGRDPKGFIRRNRPETARQLRPGVCQRAAHGRHRQRLHLIPSMEELEISPQGVSPELEPAPPVENESDGTEGTGQEACPTSESAVSVEELMGTQELPFDDTPDRKCVACGKSGN